MTPTVYILNGPNLNLLGHRQPEIYGSQTLQDIEQTCQNQAQDLGLQLVFLQSNHEGELIEWVHEARQKAQGVIINPAAYTHTSVALLDALLTFNGPVVEVHLSNTARREPFRHHSYISQRADAVIMGCGAQGYELALRRLASLLL